jgi:hypothetical protein
MKVCSKCKTEKPLTKFYKRKLGKDGYAVWCKLCHHEYCRNWDKKDPLNTTIRRRKKRLKLAYDLTPEQWQEKLNKQKGLCAMCNKEMDKPQTDHNHITGQLRDLLCIPCNIAVGHYEKRKYEVDIYLEKWNKISFANMIYYD